MGAKIELCGSKIVCCQKSFLLACIDITFQNMTPKPANLAISIAFQQKIHEPYLLIRLTNFLSPRQPILPNFQALKSDFEM